MRERNLQVIQADKETQALKLAVGLYILISVLKLGVYFMIGIMALLALQPCSFRSPATSFTRTRSLGSSSPRN